MPFVENGRVVSVPGSKLVAVGQTVVHGQSISVECNKGWEAIRDLIGNFVLWLQKKFLGSPQERVSRNNNGTWEPPIATCVPGESVVGRYHGQAIISLN